jgi:uncharacterized repeat protein (TIGR03803 family)
LEFRTIVGIYLNRIEQERLMDTLRFVVRALDRFHDVLPASCITMLLLLVAVTILFPPTTVSAQTFSVLHHFNGTTDGRSPFIGLIEAHDGTFYGTAHTGGIAPDGGSGCGTIYKLGRNGNLAPIHTFPNTVDASEGCGPNSGLIEAIDGKFYGTTDGGGTGGNNGTIFSIDSGSTFTSLFSFNGGNGRQPSRLIQASDDKFYGTTPTSGAASPGAVFRFDPPGTLTNHFLTPAEGFPTRFAGLIQGTDGSLYGVTQSGGSSGCPGGCGTVFKIDGLGTLTVLHSFSGVDGGQPEGALIQAADGTFYGTTLIGGSSNLGTVFSMDSDGNVTTLHHFSGPDGAEPTTVIDANDGNLYGTTVIGGTSGQGTLFKIDIGTKVFSSLHSFNFTDGAEPRWLIQASDGQLYGTTSRGGNADAGVFFRLRLTPALRFPLRGEMPGQNLDLDPYKATINAVFDHSMMSSYDCDRQVQDYTGELGDRDRSAFHIECRRGYGQDLAQRFYINGHYAGGGDVFHLYYDGHPGIDYRAARNTEVYGAISGRVYYPKEVAGLQKNTAYDKFHVLELIPDSFPDYRIYYLHLETHPATGLSINVSDTTGGECPPIVTLPLPDVPEGYPVKAGCLIALSGQAGTGTKKDPAPHLHFEVQKCSTKGCIPTDPYGWDGDPNQQDRYSLLTGERSVNLWNFLPLVSSVSSVEVNPGVFNLTITGVGFSADAVDTLIRASDFTPIASGQVVSQSDTRLIVQKTLASGSYFVHVTNSDGRRSNWKRLLIP